MCVCACVCVCMHRERGLGREIGIKIIFCDCFMPLRPLNKVNRPTVSNSIID